MYVRLRKNGTFELRIIHRRLPRPYHTTHDSEADARTYGARIEAMLDRGEVPAELTQAPGRPLALSAVLSRYLGEGTIAASDRPRVQWLQENVRIQLDELTYLWVQQWVQRMKRSERLAPGTIRKRVESLARAVDWHHRLIHDLDEIPANPLRLLPRGYSSYGPEDGERVLDVRRDRRLAPGEAERIEAALAGPMLLLFRLIVNTGLRLREAYSLRVEDVRPGQRTIHVPRSKTGTTRDVPMTRETHAWLRELPRDGLVFPFWGGDPAELDRTTRRLSAAFASAFARAGVEGLTEHDLRHEATCRWMSMQDAGGRWLFRAEEVRRITGHKSAQLFERYLSLRGSDLAERLWQ